jgi:hypothetical protein
MLASCIVQDANKCFDDAISRDLERTMMTVFDA